VGNLVNRPTDRLITKVIVDQVNMVISKAIDSYLEWMWILLNLDKDWGNHHLDVRVER